MLCVWWWMCRCVRGRAELCTPHNFHCMFIFYMYIRTIWLYWCDVLDSDSFSVFQLNATRAIRGRFLAVVLILVCTYYQNCIHFELRPMFFLWLHLHKINNSIAILFRKLKENPPLIFFPKKCFRDKWFSYGINKFNWKNRFFWNVVKQCLQLLTISSKYFLTF